MSGRAVMVVRPDRIGDLMLTTPVFAALKRAWPDVRVGALVRPLAAPLLERNPDVDHVTLERGQPVGELARDLRRERWDTSVHCFLTGRTVLAATLAGIPRRIGPASRLPALLLTERVLQRRSRSVRHEAEYNLELLAPLGIHAGRVPTRLVLGDDERAWGRGRLASLGLGDSPPPIAIHPGSGNSAARWPLERFAALADALVGEGHRVLLTFGPQEPELPAAMRAAMRSAPPILAPGSVSLRQLAAVLATLGLFVSNSTGPLHMAVALGVPTVSCFALTPATRPVRWGPYPAEGQIVLTPPDTPATLTAMDRIPVEAVLEACHRQLAGGVPAR